MKILVGYLIDGKFNGIDRYLMTMLTYLQDFDIQMDFISYNYNNELEQNLKKYNSKLFVVPNLKHPIKQYKEMQNILKQRRYDVCYFNISEAFNCIGILASYKAKIRKVVVHSHNSQSGGKNLIVRNFRKCVHLVFKNKISNCSTDRLACSNIAGKWMFNKDYKTIYNAVDYKLYKYNENKRIELQDIYGLEGYKILGHVSNFCYAKNTSFLIEVIHSLPDEYKLLLIGDGPEYSKCKELVSIYNLEEKVIFTGLVDNVYDYYNVMDALLLPSHFEGLPIVAIEAQYNGLKVFMSEHVTKEVKLFDSTQYIPLKKEAWISQIMHSNLQRNAVSNEMVECFSLNTQKRKILKVFGLNN